MRLPAEDPAPSTTWEDPGVHGQIGTALARLCRDSGREVESVGCDNPACDGRLIYTIYVDPNGRLIFQVPARRIRTVPRDTAMVRPTESLFHTAGGLPPSLVGMPDNLTQDGGRFKQPAWAVRLDIPGKSLLNFPYTALCPKCDSGWIVALGAGPSVKRIRRVGRLIVGNRAVLAEQRRSRKELRGRCAQGCALYRQLKTGSSGGVNGPT